MLDDRRQIAAFSAHRPCPQRGGDDRPALAQQRAQVELRPGAALQADDDQPARRSPARRRCGRGTSRPCCRGSRRPRRWLAHHLDEVLVPVVDRPRRRRARRQTASFSAVPAVVTTRAPSACASWMAIVPMPPAPPWTRKTSSGRSPATMNTLDHTVQATSGSAAAVTRSTPAGTGITWPAGTTTLLGVPAAGQQGADLVTRSPVGDAGARPRRRCRCTPGRARRTPRAAAGRGPCRCSRSARLTAVAATSTSTSPRPGLGVGQLDDAQDVGAARLGGAHRAHVRLTRRRSDSPVWSTPLSSGTSSSTSSGSGAPGGPVPLVGQRLGPSGQRLDGVAGRRPGTRPRSRAGRS